LPPTTGRGNRARFCQDGKKWGSRNLSCRDAEAVLVDAESLRTADTALDDTAITALAEQLDRILGPARGLVDTLGVLREQLDSTVVAAMTERDNALEDADAQRRLAGLAEAAETQARADATEAQAVAEAALDDRDAARQQRDNERTARSAAEQAQQRAEGHAEAARDEHARATERADAAITRVEELATALARTAANLDAAHATLTDEKARNEVATTRTEAAEHRADELTEHLETLRAQYEQTTAALQVQLTQSRTEFDARRDEFDEKLATSRVEHDKAIRAMTDQELALHNNLRAADAARGAAELAAGTARDRLERIRAAGARISPTDTHEMPEGVQALLTLLD
jgi:chromosome segregation ATPase